MYVAPNAHWQGSYVKTISPGIGITIRKIRSSCLCNGNSHTDKMASQYLIRWTPYCKTICHHDPIVLGFGAEKQGLSVLENNLSNASCCGELFSSEYLKMYLHFISFLSTEMPKLFSCGRRGLVYSTYSILWLLWWPCNARSQHFSSNGFDLPSSL